MCGCVLNKFAVKNKEICAICGSISIWIRSDRMLIPIDDRKVDGSINYDLLFPNLTLKYQGSAKIKHVCLLNNDSIYSNTRINKHGEKYHDSFVRVSGDHEYA